MARIKCPICGCKMVLTEYPTNKGFSAECVNKDCEAWGHKFDLDGLKRSNEEQLSIEALIEFLFYETTWNGEAMYFCNSCGRAHSNWRLIHHKIGCKAGKFIRKHN